MSSVGIDANTGQPLVGWKHVEQSIVKIITTEIGERVQRRDFGSAFPTLLDRPQNEETVLKFYVAIAEALEPRMVRGNIYGEPRFQLQLINIDVTTPGAAQLSLSGDYLPDGHKGKIANATATELRIPINPD